MSKFFNSISTTNGILIGLVVVVAACVGYYFWHKNHVENEDEVTVNGPAVDPAAGE